MARGLDPAIHDFVSCKNDKEDVDARVKPGHDEMIARADFFVTI